MFGHLTGTGLHIGTQKIHLILLKKQAAGLKIVRYGYIQTPPGTVDNGIIIDPDAIGEELRLLVKELRLSNKRVISAVGGSQIYFRKLIMPLFKHQELKAAAFYQAARFLPISLQEAAVDICPLREFEDKDGMHVELFFLAARRAQVENLEIAVKRAGLKLAAVEIEPLALYRLFEPGDETCTAILFFGFNRSHFTVFKAGVPIYHRLISIGGSQYDVRLSGYKLNIEDIPDRTFPHVRLDDEISGQLLRELKRVIDHYLLLDKTEVEPLEKILICGLLVDAAWEESMSARLGIEVKGSNIFTRLELPLKVSDQEKVELMGDYQTAIGLALRQVL